MTMKNDANFQEEFTCRFKFDMRNLRNFDSSTQKSQKFAIYWALFVMFGVKKCRVVMFDNTED